MPQIVGHASKSDRKPPQNLVKNFFIFCGLHQKKTAEIASNLGLTLFQNLRWPTGNLLGLVVAHIGEKVANRVLGSYIPFETFSAANFFLCSLSCAAKSFTVIIVGVLLFFLNFCRKYGCNYVKCISDKDLEN